MVEFIESTHEYLYDGLVVPSVTQIMRILTSKHYENINPVVLENARLRGQLVHDLTEELDLTGELGEVPEIAQPYLKAYSYFKQDSSVKHLRIEKAYGSPEYCGRIDRISEMYNDIWLIDIKATSAINKKLLEVQLAGYLKLVQKTEDIEITKCGVVHLTPKGYKLKEITPNIEIFEALLKIYRYQNG